MASLLLAVEYQGEWVEKAKSYIWVAAVKEARPILISRTTTFDELVAKIIKTWDIPREPKDLCITYMLSVASKQKSAPTRIRDDDDVVLYLADVDRAGAGPTLRVTLVPDPVVLSHDQYKPVDGLDDISSSAIDVDMVENEEKNPPECKDDVEIYSSGTVASQSSHIKGGSRKNKCGICRRFGHKRTTCPAVTRPSNVADPSTV